MCCFALFKTTEPRRRQWADISEDLAEMLEECIEQNLNIVCPSFDPVLKVLETLRPDVGSAEKRGDSHQKAETERMRTEKEEAERQRKELLRRQKEEEDRQKADLEQEHRGPFGSRPRLPEHPRRKADLEREHREQEEAENLRRWRDADQARIWVEACQGKWTHADWTGFLENLQRSEFWPMDPSAVGDVVEQRKQEWFAEKQREETRQKAEMERKRREEEEADRQRKELEQIQKEEASLAQLIQGILDRTQGKLVETNSTEVHEFCKQHRITMPRAREIAEETRKQWQKARITTNSLGMEFAWIPPGTFLMGSSNTSSNGVVYLHLLVRLRIATRLMSDCMSRMRQALPRKWIK